MLTGPAPENVTSAIYKVTQTINEYYYCSNLDVDLDNLGEQSFKVQPLWIAYLNHMILEYLS